MGMIISPYRYAVAGGGNGLLNNLEAYWKFDEGSGTTVADATGNGFDLTDSGTVNIVTGKLGNAKEVLGSGYFTGDGNMFDNISDKFSCGGWAQFYTLNGTYSDSSGSSTYREAFRCDDGLANNGILIRNHAGNFEVRIGNGTGYYGHEDSTGFSANTWYYLFVTYNASTNTFVMYVNGSAVYTDTGASWGNMLHPGTGTLSIMGQAYNGSERMDGILDEWGLWSRELSSTDIATLYNSGSGLAYSSFTS